MTFKIIKKTTSEGTRYFARRKWLFFWLAVKDFTYSMETVEVDFESREDALKAIEEYVARKTAGKIIEEEIINF